MRLADWLEENGPGARARLARATGLRWQSIDHIARGMARATVESAFKIQKATREAVTVSELLGLDTRRRRVGNG